MRKSKFTEVQILSVLESQNNGKSIKQICREHSISEATFYNWKLKYAQDEIKDSQRIRDLQLENDRLKRIVANLTLENDIIKSSHERRR